MGAKRGHTLDHTVNARVGSACVPAGPAAGALSPEAEAAWRERKAELLRQRVARYREKHRRIEWSPSADALRIIDFHRCANPGLSASELLDRLVVLAHRAVTGIAQR